MFYGEPKEFPIEFELFFNLNERFPHLHFYYFSNSTILENLNITENLNSPFVVVLKTFDEELNVYAGNFTAQDIHSFIKIYSRPVTSTLTGDSYLYILNERISFISLLINDDNPKLDEIKEAYYESSYKYRSILMSFVGNLEDLKGTTLTYEFNVRTKDLPVMLIEEFTPEKTVKRYKSSLTDLESKESILDFFDRFYQSKVLIIK